MTLGEFYAQAGPFTATLLLIIYPLGIWKSLELVGALLDWLEREED